MNLRGPQAHPRQPIRAGPTVCVQGLNLTGECRNSACRDNIHLRQDSIAQGDLSMHPFQSFRTTWSTGCLFIFSAACAMAQSNSAVIVGTVSDSTAAAIVGAKVTVENQGTNISTTVTTKSDGQYTVTNLEPGSYRVTAASAGFAEK